MSKKLFIGNIEWKTTEEELEAAFSEFGEVEEAIIIKDKMSGRPKGFGFVSYKSEEEAEKAMDKLNGFEMNGRPLVVKEARPQKPRDDRGGDRDF